MRHALQWWWQRQAARLHREAECIRDGLLQESFGLRRGLELALIEPGDIPIAQGQEWLDKIDQFHHTVEELSNHLSPPYLNESLPLAIQYSLSVWQVANPLIWTLDLPDSWQDEPIDRSYVILTTLDELLQIVLQEPTSVTSISIQLRQHNDISKLQVEVTYSDAIILAKSSHVNDLRHLCQAFQCLAPGKSRTQRQEQTVTWYFCW
jgi:hypothetical protein